MTEIPVTINFDAVLQIAEIGVLRASVFMGFGINAADDEQFTNYELTKYSIISTAPATMSSEALSDAKNNFRLWIEAAGFRELVDSFSVFLDEIHWVASLIRSDSQREPLHGVQAAHKKFSMGGLSDKFSTLEKRLGITPHHRTSLESLNRARNCLTHRRGLVSDKDDDGTGALQVHWVGAELFAVRDIDGAEERVNAGGTRHQAIVGPGRVELRIVDRKRTFAIGQLLAFSTVDLTEICWFYQREARYLHNGAIDYAKALGVKFTEKNSGQTAL